MILYRKLLLYHNLQVYKMLVFRLLQLCIFLQEILVDEGQHVKEGQLMFRIQPVLYQAEVDKAKNKSTLITAYGYLAGYQANIKKDFASAIAFLDKIIALDPANADAVKNRDILQKALDKSGGKATGS